MADGRGIGARRREGVTYTTPQPLSVRSTGMPGCMELELAARHDERGSFVKTFHAPTFAASALATTLAETFYTVSRRGVLRGMHFQVPPYAQAKLVHCIAGAVLDVLLDLRLGSPTFGQHRVFELSGERPVALYLPPGVAHGFYTRSDEATLIYHVTAIHAPAHDTGVRWDSFGMAWPTESPVLSPRDRELPSAAEFRSPFTFTADDRLR